MTISDSYYQFGARFVCSNCAAQRAAWEQNADRNPLGRALLYGAGAAVAGCVLFAAVSMITGLRLSLISILVGFMVGRAIQLATAGRGGLKYQILAVTLTYGAITASYIPELVKGVRKSAPKSAETPVSKVRPSAAQLMLTAAVLVGIALASPILYLLNDPTRGALNVLILLFGLVQAWRLTRGSIQAMTGPYKVEST